MTTPALPGGGTDRRGRALAQLVARAAYERGLSTRAEAVLLDAFRDATRQYVTAAEGVTLRERARLAQLIARLADAIAGGYQAAAALTVRELSVYATVEAQVAAADLAALVGTAETVGGPVTASTFAISRVQAEAIARMPALVDGLPLGDGWRDLAARATAQARRAVQTGMALGEPPAQLVRRILPPRGVVDAEPAVWRGSRAQANAYVRTAVNAVQNASAMATYEAGGDDVSESYELLGVRDARQSKLCASLSGQRFRYADPKRKIPPFHPHCRTTCLPVPNWRTLGLTEPRADDPRTAPLTFPSMDQWLREQPAFRQDAILGATRGAWYRDGKMGLRQLIDADDRVLTVDQLRTRLGIGA